MSMGSADIDALHGRGEGVLLDNLVWKPLKGL